MIQVKSAKTRPKRLLLSYPRAVPLAIFIMVAAIIALSVYAIETSDRSRDQAQLNERARTVSSALERRGATTSSYLRAGAALFGTVDDVTLELFDRFVGNLKADTAGVSSEGLGWAPWIRRSEIADFEQSFFEQTGDRIEVFPNQTNGRSRVLPVQFLRPDTRRNARAIGFDMSSDAVRLEAIQAAARTSSPVATDKLVLLQDTDRTEAGFIVYMPVYDRVLSPSRVRGFIYAPFNAQQFLTSAVAANVQNQSGLRLYDRAISPDNLLAQIEPTRSTGLTVATPLNIAGHDMILVVESARGNALSPLSMATMLFGILIASLMVLLIRLLARQTVEDEARFVWLEEQNSIRNSLTRELNHRVKNTLANVLSIMALTKRRAGSLDEFVDGLDGRIRALSATHDLLTQSEWGTTPICDVVTAEMAPYANDTEAMLELEGPDIEIAPNDALSLGMAIHELATNAAKYGALSRIGGLVSVKWAKIDDRYAKLDWVETGGPPVKQERNSGFGTNLIEKIVAHELRNPVDLQFRPDGVTCSLIVPLRKPSDFAIRAEQLA